MILHLDFDGVLNPHDVFLEAAKPVLRPDPAYGIPDWVELFSFAPILEAALAPRPDVRIVLSTSWAAHLGFEAARDALPAGLRDRVIGATCAGRHALEEWLLAPSRYAQILRHAATHGMEWIAIDDDTEGWPEHQRHRLVGIENPTMGLFDEAVQARLREVLE
ncbi:MAG: HAD domain-containing protein [Rhodocyclaceae bacterium]